MARRLGREREPASGVQCLFHVFEDAPVVPQTWEEDCGSSVAVERGFLVGIKE
jgi:hypothetical protein